MKRLVCAFFIIINIISFSLELTLDEVELIENNGYTIFQNKDDTIILFAESSIAKISIGEFPKKYIDNLNKSKIYNFKDIKEEKNIDSDLGLRSDGKLFRFVNKEKSVYHFLMIINFSIENENINEMNKKPVLVAEILSKDKKEGSIAFDILQVLIKEIADKFAMKLLNLSQEKAKEEYIGILNDVSLYGKEKEIIGIKNENKNFIEKIDNYLSKIKEYKSNKKKESRKNNNESKGVIGGIDNYLNKIKKYKASKVSFFSNEIPIYNINMSSDGFAYDITTGKLASGIVTERDYNGIIILEQKLKDGLADGKYRTYYVDFNGERHLETIGEYKKGEEEGTWKKYYKNGELKEIAKYENGNLEGEYKSYYENKELEAEGEFENGNKEGKWIYYYENGEKKAEGRYKNGKKVKKWKYYNTNGKLDEEIRYTFF